MKLGYYYHVPAVFEPDGSARLPSLIGMFIKRMSELTSEPVVVFAHRAPEATGTEDMAIGAEHARWVDLGPRASAPSRLFRPGAVVERFEANMRDVDVMLIQGPTPLLPAIVGAAGATPVVLLIWGDYGSWVPQAQFSRLRNTMITLLMREYVRRQRRAARGRLAFIQNPTLAPTVDGADVRTIPFSTVSRDVAAPDDTITDWPVDVGRTTPVRLLYTGRIVRDKGVLEAVDAVGILRDRGRPATLDLVGWGAEGDPITEEIVARARRLRITDEIRFVGYVPAGPELMARYRAAHVLVLPTYWDSLPRSMQEAMAVGLPVVVTPVGGIGYYLRDREHAMFVEPKQSEPIADAVEQLADDPELRRRLSSNGIAWSARHSFEADCDTIVAAVAELVAATTDR